MAEEICKGLLIKISYEGDRESAMKGSSTPSSKARIDHGIFTDDCAKLFIYEMDGWKDNRFLVDE